MNDHIEYLKTQLHRPVIIAGNGPSLQEIDYCRFPEDALIFRANMFYLEEKLWLGTNKVDAWITNKDCTYGNIFAREVFDNKFYNVSLILCYEAKIDYKPLEKTAPIVSPLFDFEKELSMVEAYRLSCGLNPTAGLDLILWAAALGFTDIYLAGIDFAQPTLKNKSNYYGFNLPESMLNKNKASGEGTYSEVLDKMLEQKSLSKYHSVESELEYMKLIKLDKPNINIYALCPTSFSTTLFPLAPILRDSALFEIQDNPFKAIDFEKNVLAIERKENKKNEKQQNKLENQQRKLEKKQKRRRKMNLIKFLKKIIKLILICTGFRWSYRKISNRLLIQIQDQIQENLNTNTKKNNEDIVLSDYEQKIILDPEFYLSENLKHWNGTTDVRAMGHKNQQEYDENNEIVQQLILKWVSPLINTDMKILDYGCGEGHIVNRLGKSGYSILGAEPGGKLRKFAKEKFELDILSLESLFENNAYEESFDLIFSAGVFQFIHPLDYLNFHFKLKKLLKQNGSIAHLSCPSFNKRNLNLGDDERMLARTAVFPLYSEKPLAFYNLEYKLQETANILDMDYELHQEDINVDWYRSHYLLRKK